MVAKTQILLIQALYPTLYFLISSMKIASRSLTSKHSIKLALDLKNIWARCKAKSQKIDLKGTRVWMKILNRLIELLTRMINTILVGSLREPRPMSKWGLLKYLVTRRTRVKYSLEMRMWENSVRRHQGKSWTSKKESSCN